MQKSKILKGLITLSTVAVLFSNISVQAQTPTIAAKNGATAKTEASNRLSPDDEKALKDMAQANINEIAAARIAQSKAKSSEVKAFAQQMAKDHSEALSKVQTVAQKKDVALPTEPDAKHKAIAAKLEKQSNKAFDKLYMENAGTEDHKIVLSTLKSDAMKIKDPDVKALANAHMPVVEQHLKSAQQMSMSAVK